MTVPLSYNKQTHVCQGVNGCGAVVGTSSTALAAHQHYHDTWAALATTLPNPPGPPANTTPTDIDGGTPDE